MSEKIFICENNETLYEVLYRTIDSEYSVPRLHVLLLYTEKQARKLCRDLINSSLYGVAWAKVSEVNPATGETKALKTYKQKAQKVAA